MEFLIVLAVIGVIGYVIYRNRQKNKATGGTGINFPRSDAH